VNCCHPTSDVAVVSDFDLLATTTRRIPRHRRSTLGRRAFLRRRSDGLECAAWRPPRPVAQCRQFPEEAKDASVSECTWTLSALEVLRNALYKFKTYLLTYKSHNTRHWRSWRSRVQLNTAQYQQRSNEHRSKIAMSSMSIYPAVSSVQQATVIARNRPLEHRTLPMDWNVKKRVWRSISWSASFTSAHILSSVQRVQSPMNAQGTEWTGMAMIVTHHWTPQQLHLYSR